MIVRLFLAALFCVVCSSASYANPSISRVARHTTYSSCDAMRPCFANGKSLYDGAELAFQGKEITKKRLRHRHFWSAPTSKEITHRNTVRTMSTGLARVMAEGAGRVVNWHRPRAWCGWWMRRHLGVANPAGNLARWWAGFGRPAHGPAVGAIVVWRRHVGIITARAERGWIVKSGNDGHRVRERPRSVAGAIAFRWPA